jgi:uncharacterized protein YfeS
MRQLAAVSDERKAPSPDDLARQFVINALTEHDARPQLEALEEQVATLRSDLVTAVAYAIQIAGKMDTKDARRAAEQIFRKEISRE